MDRPRRSMLWQSACILLPVILLAGLAVWHLFDARKIALEEARADASELAFGLSDRLDDLFSELLDQSYLSIELDRLDDFYYPLAPTPAGPSGDYDRFLAAADDADALAALVPDLADSKTPAGLPLEPLALYRLVELRGHAAEYVERFVESAVHRHPSILSQTLLHRAHYVPVPDHPDMVRQDMIVTGGLQHWGLQEDLRDTLRPFLETPPTDSLWVGEQDRSLWLELRDGVITPVAPGNLIPRTLEAVAAETERLPDYIGAEVWVGGRNLTAGDEGGRVTWDLDGIEEGFIPMETVYRAPFTIHSHVADTGTLYAKVRAQSYWYSAVIALSTLAAVLGLVALRRSYARQVELGEMKSNFVASVSHELRAPIASVRLLAERLRSGKVDDDTKRDEYYGFIEGETHRLGTLVENVLDFSRIERGKKAYHFADTDIAELVRDTAGTMRHYADERGVRLVIELADAELHADADAEEIRQAVVNLIDNAIKFSPGGAVVTVGADLKLGTARIWVADAGPGVPKHERERIFERFYRSGSELTRETQGAGIGLSIVRHIAEGHRGEVSLECPPTGGSRFTLTFPSERRDE